MLMLLGNKINMDFTEGVLSDFLVCFGVGFLLVC